MKTNPMKSNAKLGYMTNDRMMNQDQSLLDLPALSDEAVASLLFMIEEEKMAMDLYDTLYEQTGIGEFDKISDSELKHYETLLSTAEKLDIDTSTLSTEVGVFSNEEIQGLYDLLLTQGSESPEAAVGVGIAVEETDIADLDVALEAVEVTLLGTVYENLQDASYNHLAAFEAIA